MSAGEGCRGHDESTRGIDGAGGPSSATTTACSRLYAGVRIPALGECHVSLATQIRGRGIKGE